MKVVAIALILFALAVSAVAADPTGTVVVYRVHDLVWHYGETVSVDGARLGWFDANTYLVLSLPVGAHTVGGPSHASLDVAEGSIHYVRVRSSYRCVAHDSCAQEVNAAEAQAEVAKCRLVSPRNIEAVNLVALGSVNSK